MTIETAGSTEVAKAPSTLASWALLLAIFAAVQLAALFTPPLLDDADANHAEAAQHMAESGDWVTLKVNGIRYLEKPPLPYWLDAALYRVFGENAFATHLPNSLAHAGLRLDCLAVGSTRLGPACRDFMRAGYSHRDRAISVYAIRDSRSAVELPVSAGALLFSYRHGVATAGPVLRDVGSVGAGHADEGADCAGIFCERRRSLAAAERPMAALAANSSRFPACCCFSRSPRHGTFWPGLRILTRAIRSAIIPRRGMCTASGISTSSTSISCVF